MSKQKQDKQGGGWQFPRPIEIIKCKEGNKEYMKERPARKPYGRIVKVCEFSLEAVAEFGDDDARAVWRLAKRAARDFLRVSWINKGTDFGKVSTAAIKNLEQWINNYPREILGWKTSAMCFRECLDAL